METFEFILQVCFAFVVGKSLVLGSEFSFRKWFKNRKEYTKAYNEWLNKKP